MATWAQALEAIQNGAGEVSAYRPGWDTPGEFRRVGVFGTGGRVYLSEQDGGYGVFMSVYDPTPEELAADDWVIDPPEG